MNQIKNQTEISQSAKSPRHFLSLNDLTQLEIRDILDNAIELKQRKNRYQQFEVAKNKHLALIFEASSTRTRVSFETGMNQLGGHSIFLSSDSAQIGRGEEISDTSKVISRMVDIIAARIISHQSIEQLAEYSKVPVINALSDRFHPCQILADILTFKEKRGAIQGAKVAWIGDGNNVCHSWMNAARLLDFNLSIACPFDFKPNQDIIKLNQSHTKIIVGDNHVNEVLMEVVEDADIIVTDTWVSMGDEDNKTERMSIFQDYKVTKRLMNQAKKEVLFMHCLPAYRGMEVEDEVIDGPKSVVWDEAENRLHAQKALLLFLLS